MASRLHWSKKLGNTRSAHEASWPATTYRDVNPRNSRNRFLDLQKSDRHTFLICYCLRPLFISRVGLALALQFTIVPGRLIPGRGRVFPLTLVPNRE
jgi:hypothetical protein